MRLLLVLVSLMVAFTVDCRDFSKSPGGQGLVDGKQNMLDETEGNKPAFGAQDITEGPGNLGSANENQHNPHEPEDDISDSHVLPVKNSDKDLKPTDGNTKLKKGSLFGSEVPQNLNSIDEDEHLDEENQEQTENNLRRSGCKARNACVVMGGFCVTNATLCSGRLVHQGCKGMNCQCCVPGTLELKISKLEEQLNSMKNNLTNDNLEIKTELHSMKNNITDAIAKLGCPKGMFFLAQSHQCFKFITTKLIWTAANSKCKEEGLVLAKPSDPVSLRDYIVTRYDPNTYSWLGAQGDGSYIRWQCDGKTLSSSSPFWKPTSPDSRVTTNDYLFLLTSQSYVNSHPTQPYYNNKGTYKYYPICELI